MWVFELFLGIADFMYDVWFAKRYGIGSWLWEIASFACLAATSALFYFDLPALGIVGILGTVICFICGIRRTFSDIKKARQNQTNKDEQKNKPAAE